jgi:hypothetical protein
MEAPAEDLAAALEVQLLQDVVNVVLDGRIPQAQAASDLFILQTARDQSGDFPFTRS